MRVHKLHCVHGKKASFVPFCGKMFQHFQVNCNSYLPDDFTVDEKLLFCCCCMVCSDTNMGLANLFLKRTLYKDTDRLGLPNGVSTLTGNNAVVC